MRPDAFDDLHGGFNYKEELKKAREALNSKLRESCASRDWEMGYRKLAKKFGVSPGTLYAIAKGYKLKRKPGPRPRRPR